MDWILCHSNDTKFGEYRRTTFKGGGGMLNVMGHPNWPEKAKPERSPAEQCRNVTVQNE
jgi:hypothetical protein